MTMSKVFLFLVLVLILTILFPICVIWSLNTLFGLTIQATLETWASIVILGMFLNGGVIGSTGKK